MGRKDHLGTPEELSRMKSKDLKKVTSTVFTPQNPVANDNITNIGQQVTTRQQVRDVEYPILPNVDDLRDNIETTTQGTIKTIDVALDNVRSQVHKLFLDDDAGAITEFVVNLPGLVTNRALQFFMDIETSFGGTPIVTFDPPINTLQQDFQLIQIHTSFWFRPQVPHLSQTLTA